METTAASKPWYRKRRYQFLLVVLVALLLISFLPSLFQVPLTAKQVSLNRTIDYFANNYDSTTGLIPETPGSNTFWLYSDNYLAVLAISRYDASNQSTAGFASSLHVALEGYAATLPSSLSQSQFTALNSTAASFGCSADFAISWVQGAQPAQGSGAAVLKTTANNQGPACASENYADLLFLQALYYHRLGNSNASSTYYQLGSADFDGKGLADRAYNGTVYQTYKLALYVYTSSCLGHASGADFAAANSTLFAMQDTSTGGFYTGYNTSLSHSGTSINTETTALAALALEQLIKPSSSC